ncbi:MAG: ABC transporter permease [Clostridia bacterium]|nr:ABC transporter permease [Clostridia bacterium]
MFDFFSSVFTTHFVRAAVIKGIPLLYGATGEIITEKSGHLNLGIPGIMYMGAIGGLLGAYLYEKCGGMALLTGGNFVVPVAMVLAILGCILFSLFGGLIYSVLTITFRANQNVTGLALTTFGMGLANFLGGSVSKLTVAKVSIALTYTGKAFKLNIPFLSDKLGVFGEIFFSYGLMTYLAIAIALIAAYILKRTRVGLSLRAVGENPAAADAAGINVTKYKYTAILIGSVIAGMGGLAYVMEYIGGVWQNSVLGDTGWLAIALVIFVLWKPANAILGSLLFGALCVLFNYVNVGPAMQEIIKMLPYVVTVVILVISSLRKKRENQPPQALGLPYFREDR